MSEEKSIFYIEYKKFICKRNILILSLFFVLLLVMMQIEMNEFKSEKKDILISSEIEKLKANQFDRYTPYGAYGLRLISLPSPMNFLLTFKIYSGLVATVDCGIKLEIFENKKGGDILPDISGGYVNFAGILLVFGSLLSLIYGFMAYSNKHFLNFLCSLNSFKKVFFKILISRVFFVSLSILLLLLSMIILAFINGINIVDYSYFYFALMILLVMNCFLFLGMTIGSLKKKKIGLILLIGIFITLIFITPWMINKVISSISKSISEHQTEYVKLKILMAFEKKSFEKVGTLRSGEVAEELMNDYIDNELKIFEEIEDSYKREIIEKIKKYQALSTFFPSTFYLSSVIEISSQGFNNFIDFYNFSQKTKQEFFIFYIKRKIQSKSQRVKVESFIKGGENIFYSKSSLPGNFSTGIWITLFYIAIMILITYLNTYKKVYPIKKELKFEDDLFINIEKGQLNILFTGYELLKSKLYNHFSQKEKLKSEINFVDNGNTEIPEKIDFIYLVDIKNINDISPNTLYKFLFGEKLNKNMEIWEVLFKYALNKQLIVLDEFFNGLNPENIADMKLQLKEKNVFNLVISSDYYLTKEIADNVKHIYYLKNDTSASVIKNNI
jgi:hypothetical protein